MAGFRKAERKKAKLRLGISGPAGAGKTYSALVMAYGMTGNWDEIGLIDTENHSGELYANHGPIGEFQYLCIEPPYSPEKYIEAIKMGEEAGLKVIIIDSLTHAWAGQGGLLDKKGQIEKKTGNGWTAWRDITPLHNRLVEAILGSGCHIITTLRAKMDYVQEKNEQGKTVIRKVGMGSIQREGMEYEFTAFIEMEQDHMATATKDRTSLLDGEYFKPDASIGKKLLAWLESGAEPPKPKTTTDDEAFKQMVDSLPSSLDGAQEIANENPTRFSDNPKKLDEKLRKRFHAIRNELSMDEPTFKGKITEWLAKAGDKHGFAPFPVKSLNDLAYLDQVVIDDLLGALNKAKQMKQGAK